ncbi:putative late blight resistance protein homolog R1B-16 [Salvia splendens]|uniref:putative late blight resistance protein homolog R1B-16 n=1 Tax=Salvia splendens TaxID=180675 RepID=UPI001C276D92|nr:putative late blight resistance protein homolog R1B-16 [Salvia splendens]XP_042064782.1 putative late blight resistance protein homolog R1B-16 [Salvia splendens]
MASSLQPLITILEGILDPHQTRWIVDENNPQLQSLLDKATSLQKLLDSKSSLTKLDSRIREVAHQAEDIIESHMVHHMLSGSNCVIFTLSTPDLQQVIRDLDSVMEQAEKLVENKILPSKSSSAAVGIDSAIEQLKLADKKTPSSSSSSSVVVGIDGDLMQLKDRLVGQQQKKLEIVPIVGMGGVGKTTIAQKLYEDPLIVDQFAFRTWTTISQDYNMLQILKSLLHCITGQEFDQQIDELKVKLHKSLFGRKYLIVLDDIWSTKFWDEMRMYFPDNNNGSRIVITTRESDVANYANSSSPPHQVQLLSKSESWNLLRQLVFGEEECPLVLQEIGPKIAEDCDGLPLAISVIGGLLSKTEISEDVWRKIGDNVIAAISGSDDRCSTILSLSYNHLPNYLKPCFLYMGAFPEDYKITRPRLVRLWVAEGFIKSNGERSLKEEAEDWLKSLVERNLFLVRVYTNGKPWSYSMHDMLRDLCIKKYGEDMFLNGPNKFTFSNPRRVSFHTKFQSEVINDSAESMSLTRSVLYIDFRSAEFPSGAFFAARLLRVLDLDMRTHRFPTEILELVNLRFLRVNLDNSGTIHIVSMPKGITRLWNLQTLIAPLFHVNEPAELWKLSELSNLELFDIRLLKDEEMNYSVLKKLEKISIRMGVQLIEEATSWDGFLKSIPNIKKLSINDRDRTTSTAIDLSHLHKLENLTCHYMTSTSSPDGFGCCFRVIFPCNIRKLNLSVCKINSGVWGTLCALQKLEELEIWQCSFERKEETCEEEWELADGDEFPSLQVLRLVHSRIVRWIADETNFPRLRHLHLYKCKRLEEIPSGIGEISTLQSIRVDWCSKSTAASAERIMEEQSENGNDDLKLYIHGTSERDDDNDEEED